MPKVVMLRGISGSGKSTFREKNFPDAPWVSADLFFVDEKGNYNYQREKQGLAHAWCLGMFLARLEEIEKDSDGVIVVDNTNIRATEIAPYAALAPIYDCDFEIITIWTDPEIAAFRNVHGVPDQVVHAQFQRLLEQSSQLPPYWPHRIWCEPEFHQTIMHMGAHYERFLAMLQAAGIPYKTDQTMEWVTVGSDDAAGQVTFRFDEGGRMTNEGWVPTIN